MLDSKIIKNNEEKKFIQNCLETFPSLGFNLLYRLTRDGNSFENFHKKCDNIKNNLIVIESEKGRKFGAFCPEDWISGFLKKKCSNAFLFELHSFKKFTKKKGKGECELCSSKDLGPILSTDFCFKEKNMNNFYCSGKGDYLNDKKELTNEENNSINVKEVEIFQIINN
jgi:hypothetical protein